MALRKKQAMTLCLAVVLLACVFPVVPAGADEPEVRTGAFEAVFGERCSASNLANILRRMQCRPQANRSLGNGYRIGNERYSVYVPPGYSEDAGYGLLVWISAGERGDMPQGWETLLDKHKLIWVGAHRSGNQHNVPARRMALALDAVYNMRKRYKIERDRVYVSGISGGGRAASILAMHYPDIFRGGVFVVGVDCWREIAIPGQPGRVWKPMPKPRPQYLGMARRRGRYVLLTGDNDFNRRQTQEFYEKGYRKSLRHVLYLQVPGMGHGMPPAEWYEKALVFLDTAGTRAKTPTQKAPSGQPPSQKPK